MATFTIQKDELQKGLKAIAGVVEKRQGIHAAILSNVLFDIREPQQLTLTATDQEVELKATVSLESLSMSCQTTMPFRKLSDICRVLPQGAVMSFTLEDERAMLKVGRSRFSLSTLPAEGFPQSTLKDEGKPLVLESKKLLHILEKTAFAMADQDVRYFLNGMLWEIKDSALITVAADGHRLACNTLVLEPTTHAKAKKLIVPRKGVLEIMRLLSDLDQNIQVFLGSNFLRVVTVSMALTTKLLEGQFPDYERVLPKEASKQVVGDRELLKEAFLRASVLFSEKFKGARFLFQENTLKIQASTQEQDNIEEDLEVDYQGELLEIGFNIRYLLDVLSVIKSHKVYFQLQDPNSSVLIKGEGDTGLYVIMPMRI